jgi:hypothetical protein
VAFTYVTVFETYDTALGTPASGSVEFTPIDQMHNGAAIVSAPVSGTLDNAGGLSIRVAATTDPATTPVGVTYRVVEKILGQPVRTYYKAVPHNQGSTLRLSDLPTSINGVSAGFALRNAVDYDDTTPPTDGQAMVWDSTSSKFHPENVSGVGSGVTSVNGSTGVVTVSPASIGAQPIDSDLTAIAALAPTDGSLLERVAGAWTSRTPTQVKGDLALDLVNNTADLGKPLSTATTAALALKAPLADPIFTGTPTAPRFVGSVVAVTYAASVSLNASLGTTFRCVATGNLAVTAVTAGFQGQEIKLEVQASGANRTVTVLGVASTVNSGTWATWLLTYNQGLDQWTQIPPGGGSGGAVTSVNGQTGAVTLTASGVGAQPADQDLTDFAALAPANGDLLERVAGVWTSRSAAQVKGDLALDLVNNTSDAAKPLSTAASTALAAKAPIASPTFTGTASAPRFVGAVVTVPYSPSITLDATAATTFRCVATGDVALADILNGAPGQTVRLAVRASGAARNVTAAGSITNVPNGQWWVSTFTYDQATDGWIQDATGATGGGGSGAVSSVNGQTGAVTLTAAGLGAQAADSDLTSIAALSPVDGSVLERVGGVWVARTAAQLKADLALDQVSNTADAAKPVSAATQAALDAKAPLVNPTFTGTAAAPRFVGAVVTVPYAASVTLDASAGTVFRCTAPGDLTLADITGGVNGQSVRFEVFASGAARTVTASGTATVVPAGQTWVGEFTYNSTKNEWLQDPAGGSGAGGGTGAVSSVNGQTGAVTLTATSLSAQPIDSDLTAIAALAPTDGSLLSRQGGAWTGRTTAQVKTDLGIATDISAAVAGLVAGAPSGLDTLGEIATALTADEATAAALATTVAAKAPIASPTFTGTASAPRFVTPPTTLTAVSGTITPDAAVSSAFLHTATADVILADPTNGVASQQLEVLVYASGASRVLTVAGDTTLIPASTYWWGHYFYDVSRATWVLDDTSAAGSGGSVFSGYAVIDPALSDPTGAVDATPAFVAAYATGKTVLVPPGIYTVTSLVPPTTSQTVGTGEKSVIRYAGTGTMCTLTGMQRARLVDLKFVVTNAAGKLFTLSNTFNSSFTRCVFQGSHTAAGDSFATTSGHVGVTLTSNSGDNNFYDCVWLNLGAGIVTDCIQNGVVGGKFGTCWKGIYATGGGGMSLVGHIDFVSAAGATPPTDTAIHIDGATGQWWLSHVWIEGATTGIKIGTGTSGPSQFGMSNCKVAAVTTCIALTACRNPTLMNVQFAGDVGNTLTPDPITVDATNAPEGTAFVDSLITGKAVDTTTFPLGWTVHTRASGTAIMKVPNEVQYGYGAKLRMARSDGVLTDTMQVTGGPLLLFRGPGSAGTVIRMLDTSSLPILELDTATTQVNYLGVVPGATTVGPAILARGTDTNVDLKLTPKGTGHVTAAGSGVQLPSFATGSLPTASSHPRTLAWDSSLLRPTYSDGTSWTAVGSGSGGAGSAPITGNYFYPIGSGNTSTATLPQATAYAVPWELPAAVTLTRLGVDVSVVGDAGSKIRLGLYADTGTWYPGALILDAGQLLGDSATVQELTISQALSAGTIWLVAVGQSITTTAPTIRVASGFTPRLPLAIGASLPSANSLSSSYVQSSVTAGLPSTWTATVTTNSRAPRLIAKAA